LALLVCKSCKKAFISGLQEDDFCPDCLVRLRELYPSVRSFLRNHGEEAYTAQSLGKIMGIAIEDVESLVTMGFLEYRENRKAASSDKGSLYARSLQKSKKYPGGSV
jgi:hypothetical protein